MAAKYEMQEQDDSGEQPVDSTALTFTGSQERQTKGRYPSLAVNRKGKIIEVHQPSFGLAWSDKIHYQIGTLLEDFTVRWLEEDKGLSSRGDGKFPRVALNNNNTVVVVYESRRHIHYHLGKLNTKTDKIQWTGQGNISWGRYPAVALNDRGQIVIGYEAIVGYSTYYRTAQLQTQDNTTINWSKEGRKLFVDGSSEVSLAVNQTGCIVAVGHGYGDKFYFRVGTIPPTSEGQNQFDINWESAIERVTAPNCRPCISIDDAGNFTVAYQAKHGRRLFYHVGKVNATKRITWIHEMRNYDMGCHPTIALCNSGKWIEEHETNSAHRGHKLFYRTGKLLGGSATKSEPQEEEDET